MAQLNEPIREGEASTESTVSRRAVKWASWVLRFVVAAQCVGLALPVLRDKVPSAINGYLWQNLGWSDDAASLFDQIAAWTLVGVGVLTLLLPLWPIVTRSDPEKALR